MPDIRIHREHKLGLAKARKIAWQWAEQVEERFGMECSVIEGETSDTVEFTRSGCNGRLIVAADHFDLDARLGFLLGAFSRTIEGEIEKNLDELLAHGGASAHKGSAHKAADKTPGKPTPKRAPRLHETAGKSGQTGTLAKAPAKPAARPKPAK